MMKFLRVKDSVEDINGNVNYREELIRIDNIVKVFKGEGDTGQTIHVDFYDVSNRNTNIDGWKGIRKYIEQFDSTVQRDRRFEEIAEALAI